MLSRKRIYLDYAASTPVAPSVFEAMQPYFAEKFGNPGSLHSFGQEAIAAVDKSRESVARAVGANFREIIFTGSATEANNLALRGALKGFRLQVLGDRENTSSLKPNSQKRSMDSGLRRNDPAGRLKPRIIVSAIEHESVLETARDLEREGVEVIYLPVDRSGIVDLEKLKESLNDRTVLVSIMYANNEIGTIQPIAEIAKVIRDFRDGRASELQSFRAYPLFHTDAAQAFQFLDCNVDKLGVDLVTLSAHKIYGPKGIGALYVRGLRAQSSELRAVITGGGQEFGLRSGTENVPLIVGFAKAVELALGAREKEAKRITELSDYFWSELRKIYPKSEKNGVASELQSFRASELPNILNVYFPDHLAETLLTKFDLAGLAVSAGSACRSRAVESSYVIEALGYSGDRAKSSIRFSFGRPTIKEEVDEALAIVRKCL